MPLYFLDLGEGWAPAILNGQREADFIRAGQRLFCHNDRSYWIGGSTNVQPWNIFHISEYNTGDTGNMILIFTARNEGKIIFSEACVKNSVLGGGVHSRGHAWWGGHAWQGACVVGGGIHGRGHVWRGELAWHAHPRQILRDTVNERAVRILLECIIVNSLSDIN